MQKRATIVHFLTSLRVGGAERVALLLAAQQVEDGHRVLVASYDADPGESVLGAEFREANIAVHAIPKLLRLDPSMWVRSGLLMAREKVDVVHTHNDLPLIFAAGPAKLLGKRVVHTAHGQHTGPKRQLKLRRAGALCVDRYVAVSEATAEYTFDLGEVPRSKLEVILNATNLRRFRPDPEARAAARKAWGLNEDARVVGSVGRLAHVKNQALMLRAVAPLLKDGRCDALVIAGDGTERDALVDLAKELGVEEQFRLLGEIRDVPQAMSGMDLFTLSSRSEGLPLVLAEAMACGLPVVATDVGGVAKVVDHASTGYVVPPGEEGPLRDRIAEILLDRDKGQEMGLRGRALAQERYSIKRMANDYARAYGIA